MMIDVCDKTIKRFGKKKQLVKAVEEMGELLTAMSKHSFDSSEKRRKHVLEEIADCHIMLCQLAMIYDSPDMDQYRPTLRRKMKKLEKIISTN